MIKKITIPFKELFQNMELIKELARREVFDQYKGQPLGAIWSFLHPAVLIFIYIFLFGIVFQSNTGFLNENMPMPYTSYILSGMIPWLFFQKVLIGGSLSIIGNASAIKQVVVSTAVYPAKSVGAAFFLEVVYLLLALAYNLVFCLIYKISLPWTYLLLPVALILQLLFALGLAFLFASLTTYLRDLKDIVQVFCGIGIYVMPVVYLPDAVPRIFRFILYVNPFSYFIWMFQDVLYFGSIAHIAAWIVCIVTACISFFGGYWLFNKLKNSFGSVL